MPQDKALRELAAQAGLAVEWRDAFGEDHEVPPETLRAVLSALGYDAGSDNQIAASRHRLDEEAKAAAPLVVTEAGVPAPAPPREKFRLLFETGGSIDGRATDDGHLPPVDVPGYHIVEFADRSITLAVAPAHCPRLHGRGWGLAVQLYSLRRPNDGGVGDFAALTDLVRSAGRHGASAVAISPVHAQFSADPDRFSPYAPSSRLMLNVAHIPCDIAGGANGDLIDWPRAVRARLSHLRARYDQQADDADFDAWRRMQGNAVERHARFEALHAHFYGADPHHWHWRSWPEAFRSPESPAVAAFAADHAREVTYHAWLQYLADTALGAAQKAAREAGMPVGLISDLAVGTDSGGSHAWSRQAETLIGLKIGAPPDLLNPHGQDWGLVAFSPTGLRRNGYAAFTEMLRAALRHAGGVRIDHVMGLARLWVLPEGAHATEGTYLHFPQDDMLRLVALEASRHRAIVIGEDLGTLPYGFKPLLQSEGIMGLRVLYFERDKSGQFTPPAGWTPDAVAMTSTHDLPPFAGWWSGHDLEWRARLGLLGDEQAERDGRDRDRAWLWNAFRTSGVVPAESEAPPAWDTWPAVEAAIAHVGTSACELAMIPAEDVLALREQPNLPGTMDEHPNWRRRLPADAATMLDEPDVTARLDRLATARG
ncbi:MAG TPA: 4-alpha-glucanotransferase [Acidisphaera sp.]|nr:4-alpha-glucanotransferase [Acidisphaera sp.]